MTPQEQPDSQDPHTGPDCICNQCQGKPDPREDSQAGDELRDEIAGVIVYTDDTPFSNEPTELETLLKRYDAIHVLDDIVKLAEAHAERRATERAIELAEAVIGQDERPVATSIQENGRLMMGKDINGDIAKRNALRAEQRQQLGKDNT